MDGGLITNQTCPKCARPDYQFRSREKVAGEDGEVHAFDTKYRCRACTQVWTMRTPVKAAG
jgi:hypothetical protein